MATGLSIRLFGPLEVSDGAGRLLDLGTRKQRALIAMLALEPGRVVSLDRLIEELWAGEPPAGATRTLQSYLAHLRKALEPGRAPRTPPRILLTPRAWVPPRGRPRAGRPGPVHRGGERRPPAADGLGVNLRGNLTLDLGHPAGVPMALTATVNQLLTACRGLGMGTDDFAAVYHALARISTADQAP